MTGRRSITILRISQGGMDMIVVFDFENRHQ